MRSLLLSLLSPRRGVVLSRRRGLLDVLGVLLKSVSTEVMSSKLTAMKKFCSTDYSGSIWLSIEMNCDAEDEEKQWRKEPPQ